MLKQITESLLDPNSSKTLAKSLETIDLNSPEERKAILELLVDNQKKLQQGDLVQQINDSGLLLDLYSEVEQGIKALVHDRLLEVLSNKEAGSGEARTLIEVLKITNSQEKLVTLLKILPNDEFAGEIIECLDSQSKTALLCEEVDSRIKSLALDSCGDLQELKSLERQLLNKDKKTARLIQQRIKEIGSVLESQAELLERKTKLLKGIQSLASSAYAPLYDSKLIHLKESWQELKSDTVKSSFKHEDIFNNEEEHEFNVAAGKCEDKIDTHNTQESNQQKQESNKVFLESSLEKLESFFEDKQFRQNEVKSLIDAIKVKLDDFKDTSLRFDKKKFEQYLKAFEFESGLIEESALIETVSEALTEFRALFESNHKKKKAQQETLANIQKHSSLLLEKLKQAADISSPGKNQLNKMLNELKSFEKQSLETQAEFKKKFDKKTSYIKSEVENKALSTVRRLVREAEELVEYCELDQKKALETRLSTHKQELLELEDWYNFATLPKRKELLEKMEELAGKAPQTKIKQLKEQISDLQNQWKEVGHARDEEGKAIWKAFKEAGDKAYLPVKNLIERKENEKLQNLETRKKLLGDIQLFINENFKDAKKVNWNECEKYLGRSTREWQRAFPVPAGNQEMQKDFDKLIGQLESRLEPQRKVNFGKKNTLLNQAEKLSGIDNISEAIEQAKKLQQEWKAVGFSENDRELWEQFRKHCDEVFARRDEARNEQRSEEKNAIKEAQQICLELESIETEDTNLYQQEFKRLCAKFEDIKAIPKKRPDIQKQFKKAKSNAQKKLQQLSKAEENASFELLLLFCKKLAEIENRVIENNPGTTVILESFDELAADNKLQQDQLELLRKNIVDLSDHSGSQEFIDQQKDKLKRICVTLEIDLDLDSPDEDKGLRMEIQVQRLNKKFNQSEKHQSLHDKVVSAYLLGGIFSYQDPAYVNRLEKINNEVTKKEISR